METLSGKRSQEAVEFFSLAVFVIADEKFLKLQAPFSIVMHRWMNIINWEAQQQTSISRPFSWQHKIEFFSPSHRSFVYFESIYACCISMGEKSDEWWKISIDRLKIVLWRKKSGSFTFHKLMLHISLYTRWWHWLHLHLRVVRWRANEKIDPSINNGFSISSFSSSLFSSYPEMFLTM